MIELKAHNKTLGQYNEIDRFILVPKKLWEDFGLGDIELKINGHKVQTRVYDTLCNCVSPEHNHRLIDLRAIWDKLKIKDGDSLEIEK